jgi:hypothetical protein
MFMKPPLKNSGFPDSMLSGGEHRAKLDTANGVLQPAK